MALTAGSERSPLRELTKRLLLCPALSLSAAAHTSRWAADEGLWLDVWHGNEGMEVFVIYKRWRLKDGKQEADLVDLVRNDIIPHYAKLGGCMRLGLHR